jgi:hypothetical protein
MARPGIRAARKKSRKKVRKKFPRRSGRFALFAFLRRWAPHPDPVPAKGARPPP